MDNQEALKMMFSLGTESGKSYMRSLGFTYQPWTRVNKKYRNETCSCGSGKKVKCCCGVSYEYDLAK